MVTVENGPPVGKEIQIELSGDDLDLLFTEATRIRTFMETELGDQLIDIDDTAPIPGIEWEFIVTGSGRHAGANMAEIGTASS